MRHPAMILGAIQFQVLRLPEDTPAKSRLLELTEEMYGAIEELTREKLTQQLEASIEQRRGLLKFRRHRFESVNNNAG